jgi:hypothetical protein
VKARALITVLLAIGVALLLASPVFADEGGEGIYGKADDKVITNFGYGLMILFTVLVAVLSLGQHLLGKRKK